MLDHLGVVALVVEGERDDESVGVETVSVDRWATSNRRPQLVGKLPCAFWRSLATVPAQQQFRVSVNRSEDVAISLQFGIKLKQFLSLSLASDKSPLFVTFDGIHGSALNGLFHESLTGFASRYWVNSVLMKKLDLCD